MEDEFLERLIEEMKSFEGKGWSASVIGNFPSEEKLYVTDPEGWRRNAEYCKMENYVNGSENRKNTINFYKLCKAAYKYYPELWSETIVGE